MSKAKSIDGLRRRDEKGAAPVKRRVIRVKTKAVAKQTARRELGIQEKANKPKDKAIRDYLASIKDDDPANLTGELKKKSKKQNKRKAGGKKKVVKRILLVLLVLILVALGVVYVILNDFVSKVTDGGSLISVLTSNPNTPLEKDESGRTNILVFGTEGYNMDDPKYDGGHLTDSMLMISIDQDDNSVKAVSLPRDLKYGTCTSTGKLNEVYYCQYQKRNKNDPESIKAQEKAGAEDLGAAFEKVLGVKIQYHVHVNWEALIKIINAIGGIDVYFTYGDQTYEGEDEAITEIKTSSKYGLADGDNNKYFYKYANGEVIHLDGAAALAVARTRNAVRGYGALGGNFSREYFQQKIIEAAIKKMKVKNIASDWAAVLSIKDAVGDNLRTNFKDTELKTLMKLIGTLDVAGMKSISLHSGEGGANLLRTGMIGGTSYVYPVAGVGKYEAIHNYIKRELSNNPIIAENATIAVLNGTSAYGVASAEKTTLEGKSYNVKMTGNAPADLNNFDGVKIYQKNDEKTKTADALRQLYNDVVFTTEIPESLKNYKYDFIIIIGNGRSYKTSE